MGWRPSKRLPWRGAFRVLPCHKQYTQHQQVYGVERVGGVLQGLAFAAVLAVVEPEQRQGQQGEALLLDLERAHKVHLPDEHILADDKQPRASEEQLLELHRNKTGALIIAAVELGCTAANAAPALRAALVQYAAEVGLVFQIVDDILDVTSTTEELGKPVGSDADNDKTTFITLYGLDGARALAKSHNDAALAALDGFGTQEDFLRLLAAELLQRKK